MPKILYNKRSYFFSPKGGGSIKCDSSWELDYTKLLDLDCNVIKFEKDKIFIPYFFECRARVYIPDFLVYYQDGHRELVEVKPHDERFSLQNLQKTSLV